MEAVTIMHGFKSKPETPETKAALELAITTTSPASTRADCAFPWPEPTPLPEHLPPVQAFDDALLPNSLRGWVMDIANRMQCPPDFPAVGAIIALSSLAGARHVVYPKVRDDWQVVPNLWGLIVGRPGVMKSPALAQALAPLNRIQAEESEQWKAAHEVWEVEAKLAEMARDGNEKAARTKAAKDIAAARALLTATVDVPAEPVARRFIVNDSTVEKLVELLQENPWGFLIYRDELYGLLTTMDRHGQEGSRSFYLQAYDGNQSYVSDRIGRGTVFAPRVCLSMLGGIQPGRIQEYVRNAVSGGSGDDGLLQRFGLTVWPDVGGNFRHVDQWPDSDAKQAAWAVFERFAGQPLAEDARPHEWRFNEAAQGYFVEWLTELETELRTGDLHPAMESHLSKYRKLIPALALVFALIQTSTDNGTIGETELLRALAWGDYLRTHANRLYAATVTPETAGAASLLKRIKAGTLGKEFTPRTIVRKGWAGLATPEAVRKAADVLAEYDWVRLDIRRSNDELGRGRPSDTYIINPAALGAAS